MFKLKPSKMFGLMVANVLLGALVEWPTFYLLWNYVVIKAFHSTFSLNYWQAFLVVFMHSWYFYDPYQLDQMVKNDPKQYGL